VSESGNQKQVGAKPELIHGEGEKATGNHLPTPPPMPEHVVKMLADFKAAGVL
jgi:hypothetical protein